MPRNRRNQNDEARPAIVGKQPELAITMVELRVSLRVAATALEGQEGLTCLDGTGSRVPAVGGSEDREHDA